MQSEPNSESMNSEREERIRARAYQLWNEEGQPEGKEAEHWERARAEIEGGQGGEDTPARPPKEVAIGP